MKYNDPTFSNLRGTEWQVLGELKLPVGSSVNAAIYVWLMKSLHPLNLHADFLSKILKSIEEAAERAMKRAGVEAKFDSLNIFIFAPGDHPKGQAWGFFRVERMDTVSKTEDPNKYVIEYYLFQDGKSEKIRTIAL